MEKKLYKSEFPWPGFIIGSIGAMVGGVMTHPLDLYTLVYMNFN